MDEGGILYYKYNIISRLAYILLCRILLYSIVLYHCLLFWVYCMIYRKRKKKELDRLIFGQAQEKTIEIENKNS